MMKTKILFPLVFSLIFGICKAEKIDSLNWSANALVNASSGQWAPYMIGSWNDGRVTEAAGGWLDLSANKSIDLSSRFSWSAGIEAIFGGGTNVGYQRWNTLENSFYEHSAGTSPARLIQLWGQIKFRGVFATLGMRSEKSLIVADGLSSGDLTRSNNARPIPGLTVGFIDFQNIPFTNGWVQIEGQLMYGRMTDTRFNENRYNYFNSFIAGDLMYTYKRCYFRTKPTQPFYVTVGMQTGGLFGGNTTRYDHGEITERVDRGFHIKDLWNMFFPIEGGEQFYSGSSLGSWDFRADIKLKSGHKIAAYFEWPWEDGSGIGRRNGWDGVWGIEYRAPHSTWIDGAVLEYVDFTNMSGPIHWAPGDSPGTTITTEATGGDNYWNNDVYGAWANYGMSIATPFILAPLYNSDGYLLFKHSRSRGFHAAFEGQVLPKIRYKAMISYQAAWGDGRRPSNKRLDNTSALLEARWHQGSGKPWSAGVQLAFDSGSLRGNNFGALISISYSGAFKFAKQ